MQGVANLLRFAEDYPGFSVATFVGIRGRSVSRQSQLVLKWDFDQLQFAAPAVVFLDKPGAAAYHPAATSIGDSSHGSNPILSFTACRNRCLHPR